MSKYLEAKVDFVWLEAVPKKLVTVKAIIPTHLGRILLVRPDYNPDWWQFPGGGVEANEDPDLGLVREVEEETGLTLPVEDFLLCGSVFRPECDNIILFYEYQRRLHEATPIQCQPGENEHHLFAARESVSPLIAPYHRDFWSKYLARESINAM